MVQISKWQMALVGLVLFFGALFAAPNVTGPTGIPGLPQNPVTLGLDLQGGAYLVLEVEVSNAEEDYLNGVRDQMSRALLRERIRISRPVIENNVLTFRVSKPEDMENAGRILRQNRGDTTIETNEGGGTITSNYPSNETDMGAEVQRMGQGDVYQALESGLIDCNQNYYYSILLVVQTTPRILSCKLPQKQP